MKKNKKKAFTLAEILITLSIIGVVAALTILVLIQRTGDEEALSRLKKTFSILSQATELIITENGSPKVWMTDADAYFNMYKSHLRGAKECGTSGGCFSQGLYKKLNGRDSNWNFNTGGKALILTDGVQLAFEFASAACNGTGSRETEICGTITADINGSKAPNIIGRDVFRFMLKENGLYPVGCNSEEYCGTDKDAFGYECTCKALREDAMNY